MNYEMMMARNASIIEILKEKQKEQITKEAEKRGEKKKALETAKNLKKLGVDINIIEQATGLTLKEIEEL